MGRIKARLISVEKIGVAYTATYTATAKERGVFGKLGRLEGIGRVRRLLFQQTASAIFVSLLLLSFASI